MNEYKKGSAEFWEGRDAEGKAYLHQKVTLIDIETDALAAYSNKAFGILGYASDAGVKRNQGRIGAAAGPNSIRKMLGKLPNHISKDTHVLDIGNVSCVDDSMEFGQELLAQKITGLLDKNIMPLVLGGSHDIAYGHFKGIQNYFASNHKKPSLGILNFDAHFDLRSYKNRGNSGTPFLQIAEDCAQLATPFHYLCLGIRSDANSSDLFRTAKELEVNYILNEVFNLHHVNEVLKVVEAFISQVDLLYVSIDLDGFSSAIAPGVSAPSPMGFSPDIVLEVLKVVLASKKLLSLDIAEMNPNYDQDNSTAKLAASLLHFVIHKKEYS